MVKQEPLSPRNAEVARLRALARDRRARHEAGRFVVEGIKLVTDVLASDLIVFEAFGDADWDLPADIRAALEADDVELTRVSSRGIERIASTSSPQPVVAEVKLAQATWRDLPEQPSMLVAVDVNDPGNVGTLARSAVAAGFNAIVCLGDTADAFAPKVIRASAGALFHVPVIVERDVAVGLQAVAATGAVRYGTRMNDATACDEADLTGPVALVLGSEAHGLSPAYNELIDEWLSVPMPGRTESLNVAMAGTIITYEVARQRRSQVD
ncbi:MAG: TrmH family RNA methyltransferase [Paracrocinitomix sp.]